MILRGFDFSGTVGTVSYYDCTHTSHPPDWQTQNRRDESKDWRETSDGARSSTTWLTGLAQRAANLSTHDRTSDLWL